MNKLLDMNFKKIFIGFIIFAIIIGIGSLGVGGYIFKDKISFIYHYDKIKEEFKRNDSNTIKNELSKFSNDFNDIADILVLDKDNNVVYSAKQKFTNNSNFELDYSSVSKKYLVDKNNEDVMFYLTDNEELMLSLITNKNIDKIKRDHDDESFFLKNIKSKETYGLSYVLNKDSNEKIYFITDIQPVKNANIYFEIVEIIIMCLFATYLIIVALWTYQNAKKNNLNAPLWGIVTLFTNIIGVCIYAIYKRKVIVCEKCRTIQNKINIYCTNCKNKLNDTCDKCGNIISKKDKYCSHCGEKIKEK